MPPARVAWIVVAFTMGGLAVGLGPDLVAADPATDRGVLWLTGFNQLLWIAIAVAIAAAAPASVPMSDRLGLRRSRLGAVPIGVASIGLVCCSLAVNGVLVAAELRERSALEEIDRIVVAARDEAPALAIVSLALLPGIAEELLFRGAILEALRARAGTAVGVVGSALLFGAAHLEPIHAAAAALLGGYLGFVAVRANSVWPAVVCHLANNATGVLAQWLGADDVQLPWLLLAAAALGCAVVVARATGAPAEGGVEPGRSHPDA